MAKPAPSFSPAAAQSIVRADQRPVAGVVWMLLTGLCFVAVTAIVKVLGDAVPAAQAAFLRYVLGLVFLIPVLRSLIHFRPPPGLLLWGTLRGLVHSLGVILWFFAMTRISIAEVTAMNYLNPVYVTLGAALFLGERLAARRIFAVVMALIGAFIILRPGFRELSDGHIAMLFTAIFFAFSYLVAKRLTDQASAGIVVAMLSITVTIGLAPFAYAVWVPVSLHDLVLLFAVACFATAGHYAMTRAFAAAPLAVTQPVTFLQLVWAAALGAVFFAEPLDIWVILGGTVILASVSFITWREAQLRKAGLTPNVNAPKT